MMHPSFSVIIPAYSRPKSLRSCLQALSEVRYPTDRFEVIVVDDGSEVSLEPVITPFQDHLRIMLLSQTNFGPASARNEGAERASGDYLVFTDDDCAPAPDWLDCFATRFDQTPDCAIGGRTINALLNNHYSVASQMLIDYLYEYYNNSGCGARFLTSNNFAVSTRMFRSVGGFDAVMPLAGGEDREFCDRWIHHGLKMVFAPEVITYHRHNLTWRAFLRQHFNYGRGAWFFHQRRSFRTEEKIRVEPASFYFDLVRFPFERTRGRYTPILAGLLIASQAMNPYGFAWENVKHGWRGRRVGKG